MPSWRREYSGTVCSRCGDGGLSRPWRGLCWGSLSMTSRRERQPDRARAQGAQLSGSSGTPCRIRFSGEAAASTRAPSANEPRGIQKCPTLTFPA